MRFLMKALGVLLFCLCVNTPTAFATPNWKSATPKADSNYRYYVGRGESSSEKKAFNQAVKDAYDQAARENFPSEYTYQADMYQTESDSFLTERTIMSGQTARFDGFTKEDEHILKTKQGYSVKLLYRFSKKAIQAEQKRLRETKSSKKREMSVMGSKSDAQKGVFVVKSTPVDGAGVFIDGERFGQTPMTLYGSLSTGKHKLRIDHPHFETHSENVIIVPGKTVSVNKVLIPAFATVKISTEPVNAKVLLDGRAIGTAPLNYDKIPVGKEVTLTLIHSEMEKMYVPLTLNKGETRPLNVNLPEKSAQISFFSFPKGADVFIDKKHFGKTPLQDVSLSRGSHTYTVEKEGYAPETKSFFAKGGEQSNKSVDLKRLEKETFVGKKKKVLLSGNVDKFHSFEERRPKRQNLNLSSASTGEDVLVAMMKWSFPSNFLRGRVSYKPYGNGTRFFITFSFDEEEYENAFIAPVRRALKNVSDEIDDERLKVPCIYDEEKEGQVYCQPPKVTNVSDTIFVRSTSIDHGVFSDKADFDTYSLLSFSDGRRDKIKSSEKRKFSLLIVDKAGKTRTITTEDVYISKFQQDKFRNVLFFPVFKGGYPSLLHLVDASRISPNNIQRVILKFGDAVAVNNPYKDLEVGRNW